MRESNIAAGDNARVRHIRLQKRSGRPERIALNPSGVTGCLLAAGTALIKAAITVIVILLGTLLVVSADRAGRSTAESVSPLVPRFRALASVTLRFSRLNVTARISCRYCLSNDFPDSRLMRLPVISFPSSRQKSFASLAFGHRLRFIGF